MLLTVLVATGMIGACGGGATCGQGSGPASAFAQWQGARGQGEGRNCEEGKGGGEGQGSEGQGGNGDAGGEGFNGTDVAWIQLMIAMNEQVLPLLDLATGELATPAVTVRKGHERELAQLKALRKQAGLTEANPHAGHLMPGLVTEQDLQRSAKDRTRLISKVVEHLEQRIILAKGAGSSGTSKGVKSLAAAIEQASVDALVSWRALSMEWVPSVHPSKEI